MRGAGLAAGGYGRGMTLTQILRLRYKDREVRSNQGLSIGGMNPPNLRRRLQKLELRREEERSFELPPGEGRRLLEAQIATIRHRMGLDHEGYEAPDIEPEAVKAMIHAHAGKKPDPA